MTTRAAVLTVLCCVVFAGCSVPVTLPAGSDSNPATSSPPTVTTPASAADGRSVDAERRTDTATAVAPSDNPYDEETLTVALDASNVSADRTIEPVVRESLDYWEANAERYAGYSVEYRLLDGDADRSEADVVVRFVDDVRECGHDQHVAGCAPYVTRGPVERPVLVRVQTGYDDDSTRLVLSHELGHTLGLDHDDDPRDVMAAQTTLTTLPRTDAADRAFAWNDSTLAVYVDDGRVPAGDRDAVDRQVTAALDYFERGADGTVPDNVSFERVDGPREADVVIRFAETSPCGASPGSCGRLGGFDPDGDGRLERYTDLEITLAGLDADAVAWHVARWVGLGLGLDSDEEYPEPLRSTTGYEERRGEWWR